MPPSITSVGSPSPSSAVMARVSLSPPLVGGGGTDANAKCSSDDSDLTTCSSPLLGIFLRTNADAPRIDASDMWDFLTLRDLYQLRSVSKSAHAALEMVEYNRCRDGKDYQVPFPAFPAILSTPEDIQNGAGLFTHQLASLRGMIRAENANTAFGALRGGVLGDAPGLGKTITMLSLIANTSGLKPVEPKEFYDNQSIDEHWKIMRTNPVFREEILRAIKHFRESSLYPWLAEEVSPPFKDERFPTLASFEKFVNRHMRRAEVPQSHLDLFRRNVNAFKAGLDKRNRRYFSNEKGRRMLFERNLVPCSATLIIVPDALLEHWAEQMRRHVNLGVLSDFGGTRGVVYVDGVGDLSEARFPLNHRQMSLPSAFDLMSHAIVVVPFSRIREQHTSAKKRTAAYAFNQYDRRRSKRDSESLASSSPLLRLRWFRIVVDEGHELGENEASSEVTSFVNKLAAERRWAMSGTPTTGDEDDHNFTAKGLDQLQRLLLFLRHEKYGTLPERNEDDEYRKKGNKERAKGAWVEAVKKPFLKKQEDGRKELYRVLDEVMVMHRKEDIGLPKPIFKQSEAIVPVPSDIQSVVIDAVLSTDRDPTTTLSTLSKIGIANQRRTLDHAFHIGGSTLFDALVNAYLHTDNFQTLVDEAMANFITEGVKRERQKLEERGGAINEGVVAPITAATDPARCSSNYVDRRPIKAVVYSNSHNNLLSVAEYLIRSFDSSQVAELMEGRIEHMAYELGRFRNGYKEGKNCPICGGWNEYTGKNLTSCGNVLLEVVDIDENIYLIEPERVLRAVGRSEYESVADIMPVGNSVESTRLEGAPLTEYRLARRNWRVNDILCADLRHDHPLMKKRWREEKWAMYGSARCRELAAADGYEGRNNYLGPLPSSQENGGREVMVTLKKWQTCGGFHSRPRWNAIRKKHEGWYQCPSLQHVKMSQQKEVTFILLLDASLSHGLDLSFVTHMYLLEPIDDAALLEQVTSRAHRLGCTGPVTVETIHVWHEMDSNAKRIARELASTVQDEGRKKTSTAVCDHCYRSFESIEKANEHELTCDRNPDGNAVVDPYHLSSVYRDIRPPAPMIVGATEMDQNEMDRIPAASMTVDAPETEQTKKMEIRETAQIRVGAMGSN